MAKPKDLKKTRITIRLDADVVQYFQMLAEEQERPYQPLMNKVLRNFVEQSIKADKAVAEYKARI